MPERGGLSERGASPGSEQVALTRPPQDAVTSRRFLGVFPTCCLAVLSSRGCGPEKGPRVPAAAPPAARAVGYAPARHLRDGDLREWTATKEPIPVLPTVHYNMGGIPTNYKGQVIGWRPPEVPCAA